METNSTTVLHDKRLKLYRYAVTVAGTMVFVINLIQLKSFAWKEVAIFIVLHFLAQLLPTKLPQGYIFSVSFIVDLALMVLFGTPVAVTTTYVMSLVTKLIVRLFGQKESIGDIFWYSAQNALVIGLSGLVYGYINDTVFSFTVAAVVYFIFTTLLLSVNSRLFTKRNLSAEWITTVRMLYVNYAVISVIAFIMTVIYKNTPNDWRLFNVLLFFLPTLLISHSFRLYNNTKQSYLNTVKTLVRAIEAKDPYTRGHSEHVAELTLALAREVGIRERDLQKLEYVTLLHDAGKIGIPEEILNKQAALTAGEYDEIKKHSALSADILQKIKFLSSKSDIVLYHHEKYNGTGYPAGLQGEEIPLESRMMAIADAYDAMTTDRPFRSAKTPQQAVEEMMRLAGRQFDPRLIDVFKTVLKRRGEL